MKKFLAANWSNPFLSYQQWLNLAEQAAAVIKRYGKGLTKSGNVFAEQLFGGYLAVFSNHCVEQYGLHRAKSQRFTQAVSLFYSPCPPSKGTIPVYLVFEMHGGLHTQLSVLMKTAIIWCLRQGQRRRSKPPLSGRVCYRDFANNT